MITLFIKCLDNDKLYNLQINRDNKISNIISYISTKLDINDKSIKLYSNNTLLNVNNLLNSYKIFNNSVIYAKIGLLKGGTIEHGIYSIKMNKAFKIIYGPLIIMIICLTIFVPIYYLLLFMLPNYSYFYCCLMEESSSYSNLGIIMNFFTSYLSNLKAECKKINCNPDSNFELIFNRISNNQNIFTFFRSPVYIIYSVMIVGFIIMFAVLQSLTRYIESFGKISKDKQYGKCYLISDTKNINIIGTITLIILPIILISISLIQSKYSILISFSLIAISFIFIMTTVYPLEKQRDGVLINYMKKLYLSPIIGVITYLIFYFIFVYNGFIHMLKSPFFGYTILDIIFKFILISLCGVAACLTSIIPLLYVIRYEIPRYCLYFPDCNKLSKKRRRCYKEIK